VRPSPRGHTGAGGISDEARRCACRAAGIAGALVAFGLIVSGCGGWQETLLPPEFLVQREHPGRVRVTLRDGTRCVIHHPTISNGSLVGTCRGSTVPKRYFLDESRIRVPFAEITTMDTRSAWDPTGTVALVAAGTAVGLLAFTALFISGWP
jgi:hypothetical protein